MEISPLNPLGQMINLLINLPNCLMKAVFAQLEDNLGIALC